MQNTQKIKRQEEVNTHKKYMQQKEYYMYINKQPKQLIACIYALLIDFDRSETTLTSY